MTATGRISSVLADANLVERLRAENASLRRELETRSTTHEGRDYLAKQLRITEQLTHAGSVTWAFGDAAAECSLGLRQLLSLPTDRANLSLRALLRMVRPVDRRPLLKRLRAIQHTGKPDHDIITGESLVLCLGAGQLPVEVTGHIEAAVNDGRPRITLLCRVEHTRAPVQPRARTDDTLLQRVLDAAPDGLLVFDMGDGAVVDTNDRFCELSGYARTDLIGRTEHALLLWADQALRERVYSEVIARRAHANLEVVMRRKDGTTMETLIAVRTLQAETRDFAIVNVRDVSDYKQTMRALAESEQRFAQAFKEAPFSALIARLSDGAILDINDAFTKLVAGDSKPLATQTLQELAAWVEPDYRAAFLHACAAASSQVTIEFRLPTGKAFAALVSSRVTHFHGDDCVTVFLEDISDRTDAEHRFAQALNTNPDGALVARYSDGEVVEVNAAFTQITGFEASDIVGTPAGLLGMWAELAQRKVFSDLLRAGPVRNFAMQLRRNDRVVVPVALSATRSQRGGESWVVVNLRDMSREVEVDRVLRASRERFEKLFRTAPLAIALYHLADGSIVDVNPAFVALFGDERATLRGHKVDSKTWWANAEQYDEFASRLAQSNEVRDFETRLNSQRGQFHALVSARATRIDGEPHAIVYVSNIDDIKKMQEQLQHGQKLEAIGQLAGGVAHDFNNLLSGIQGFTELMLLQDDLQDTSRTYARQVLSTVQRAAQLTKQLLIFARRDPPQLKPVDLHDAIHNTVAILEHSIDRRVEIIRHLASPNPMVLGDRSQIENALLNLCINARDAIPLGGHISITTGLINLGHAELRQHKLDLVSGQYLRLTVSDTGTGIAPELVERIFDPFFTTKEAGRGTGLGLAAVWGMLRAHNGGVAVETQLGFGTSFHLYFKPSMPTAPTREFGQLQQITLGTGRILLVDDEADLRELVGKMLTNLGYEVSTAEDGLVAVNYYKQHANEIDLVLLDMTMPRLNGHDTFVAMQKCNPDVRALLTSGYVQNDDLVDTLARGALGVLHKPFDLRTLSVEVGAAMTRHRTVRR